VDAPIRFEERANLVEALMHQTVHRRTPPIRTLAAGIDPPGPRGELASRVLAMPADTNPMGNIFGGWIMALMDSAGAMSATRLASGPVVTAAVSQIAFLHPVKVGDVICCYTDVVRFGVTSVTFAVEVWVLRQGQGERIKVTQAEYTFVAVDGEGRPRPVRDRRHAGRRPDPDLGPGADRCHDPAADNATRDTPWTPPT
jgi:acyl-CoA thioesterase YciA